ncbi:MAG: hypothetical protein ABIK09_06965 [Pseudomonadota bacterium]
MYIGNTLCIVVGVAALAWACESSPGPSAGGDPGGEACDCSCSVPDSDCAGPDAGGAPADGSPAGDTITGACIEVMPQQIKFGGKKVGELATLPLEIRSCGEADLEIDSIKLTTDSHPAYGLDLEMLSHTPSEDDPVVMPSGETVTVLVTYLPECPDPVHESGYPPPVVGEILIRSSAPPGEKLVEVGGFGALIYCPTAVITCAEGETTAPWTDLHLSGEESHENECSDESNIAGWQWAVSAPIGSQARFEPSAEVEEPTFRPDVAGKYAFLLTVYDAQNVPSCAPATHEVVVVPDDAIWIELFWETPGDPDESDTGPAAGADLDLHLQRPGGVGLDHDGDGVHECWLDPEANCFWFSPNPDWWEPGPQDDPEMVVEDYDGAGPELIGYPAPAREVYLVGVHDYNDHGFGESLATVRIYIHGQLVLEVPEVSLVDLDLWTVARIEWPSGEVTVCTEDGAYCILPDYIDGFYPVTALDTCGPF